MNEPESSAPESALAELLDVSPQVDAAVIVERASGTVRASAPSTMQRVADRLAESARMLIDAAERARTELGREPVTQIEVASPDGHVFVVSDPTWLITAVTHADPTVGLVFYDLKTALRTVREDDGETAAASTTEPSAGATSTTPEARTGSEATTTSQSSAAAEQSIGATGASSLITERSLDTSMSAETPRQETAARSDSDSARDNDAPATASRDTGTDTSETTDAQDADDRDSDEPADEPGRQETTLSRWRRRRS